jgi:hypothetical protein
MPTFCMRGKDTFFFDDGTVVFAGPVESDANFIRACDCEIVKNGEVKTSLRIEDEMRPNWRPGAPSTDRAVSTREAVDLTALGLGKSGFLIRSED